MKLIKILMPHLTISFHIAMLVVIYLDMRNPMMGFMSGAPYQALVLGSAICSISTAVLYVLGSPKRSFSGKI